MGEGDHSVVSVDERGDTRRPIVARGDPEDKSNPIQIYIPPYPPRPPEGKRGKGKERKRVGTEGRDSPPKSPQPGMMYFFSLRCVSHSAVTTLTSGYVVVSASRPSGHEIRLTC